MALVNCPECGAQISDKALSCPKCGHPMINQKKPGAWHAMGIGWMALSILVLVVALFALLSTCNWKSV